MKLTHSHEECQGVCDLGQFESDIIKQKYHFVLIFASLLCIIYGCCIIILFNGFTSQKPVKDALIDIISHLSVIIDRLRSQSALCQLYKSQNKAVKYILIYLVHTQL